MTVTGATTAFPTGRSDVEVRIPADGAYVSVLRTTAAGLGARLDFTIDDIEDLRIAVAEATSIVLPEAADGSDLVASFHLGERRIHIVVRVTTSAPPVPEYESFAWQVLTTLAASADEVVTDDTFAVRLTIVSGVDL